MTTKKLSISPVALSVTDLSVLKVALGILANSAVHVEILSAGDTSGSIVLVDADSDETAYQALNGVRGQTLIALTEQTLNDTRNIVLKKPLRVQTLRDVLMDIAHQSNQPAGGGLSLNKPQLGSNADVVKSAQSDTPFSATQNLFFVLLEALRSKQRMQVFYPPFSPMYADGENGIIATSASRSTLRKMVSQPSPQLKTLKLSDADFDILARGQMIMQFSHVLWSAGIFGSQGQLVDGHTLDEPVRLKAWPNFSRLDFEQAHMALASLMAGKPMTIKQVHEKTKIDKAVIVGFFNAALVTGLLELAPVVSAKPAATPDAPPEAEKKAGLFAKIARRLNIEQP